MEKARQYVTLSADVYNWVGKMAQELNMNRVDVIEVIIVFYYEYIKQKKQRERSNKL